MWENYKKTFLMMQAVIWLATGVVMVLTRNNWRDAGMFLLVMQFSSIFGARLGSRMKEGFERAQSELPLKVRN